MRGVGLVGDANYLNYFRRDARLLEGESELGKCWFVC